MSLAPLHAGAESAHGVTRASTRPPLDDRVPTSYPKAAAPHVPSQRRVRVGGRYEPLAVIEREEVPSVPSLHDATDAVAMARLSGRRDSVVRVFVQRRAAATPIDCGEATITRVLAPTHGLLIYDEQVVDLAVRLAGFSALEAEAFRRGLITESDPAATTWRVRFVQGAVERGHTVARAEGFFASLKQSAAGTVSRGDCVAEAMRILREAYGFGAVRDGRSDGADSPGLKPAIPNRAGAGGARGIFPLRRGMGQLSFPWLDLADGAEATPVEERALRRRA